MPRVNPNVVVRRDSPNQSARANIPLNLIVLHSTESHHVEGNADLNGVAGWFANPKAQASSHVITDADGNSARCVSSNRKAWHCTNYNSASLGIEQIGFASQGRWSRAEIRETARWIARWAKRYGIPIRPAKVSGGRVLESGVTTHAALGSYGGGHHDPGPHYPFGRVLRIARRYRKRLK